MRTLALLALSVCAAACAGPADSLPENPEGLPFFLDAQQLEGKAIFETMCWTCHGPAGRGDGPALETGPAGRPPSFHTPEYARADPATLERRFRAGAAGVDEAHPHMQYVSSILKPERFIAALSFIPALSYPPELPGSALAGKEIYDFRCMGCHGPGGRGDGSAAAAFIDVRPADFTTDSLISNRDWDHLFRRVREGGSSVHGSSMPPWGIVLSETEIWDVVAYLATLQPGAVRPPYWTTN